MGEIKNPNKDIVMQCPECGARAALHAEKKHCSDPTHPPMVPAWAPTGRELTPAEKKEHHL